MCFKADYFCSLHKNIQSVRIRSHVFVVFSESLGVRSKVMKKIEELKMSSVCNGTPDEYLCPITREIMKDPVIAAGEFLTV